MTIEQVLFKVAEDELRQAVRSGDVASTASFRLATTIAASTVKALKARGVALDLPRPEMKEEGMGGGD